jgi:hypothetical protein
VAGYSICKFVQGIHTLLIQLREKISNPITHCFIGERGVLTSCAGETYHFCIPRDQRSFGYDLNEILGEGQHGACSMPRSTTTTRDSGPNISLAPTALPETRAFPEG